MRFIGNKELIAPRIRDLLEQQGLVGKGLTFFDAFCGTGAVADALKSSFDLVINDILTWCVTYSRGRITAPECTFSNLGFDPFAHFLTRPDRQRGFFHKHYSPGGSARMYFTAENAGRIDHIRSTIEGWRRDGLINEFERAYLLASLIESLSYVSNTAGVYGAFLKHWDPRAKRQMRFEPVDFDRSRPKGLRVHNQRLEDIIDRVDCDILYLDPPYTQNQYGTQYHLLETLVLDDSPSLSPITGSRPTAPMRSDWSKDVHKHVLFDHVISNTKADHVILSYSPDGFMSKSYIDAALKRYGDQDSYVLKNLSYDKYTNFKSRSVKTHCEYLFYIRRKPKSVVYFGSPLNYIGSKTRMVPFLKSHFPNDIDTFVDAFAGGFNVGINSGAPRIVYNDANHLVKELMESFQTSDTADFVKYVRRQIRRYQLEKECASTYLLARDAYNSLPLDRRDPRLLYTVIMYGFNQQIRFNSEYNFNNPVGQRWFNERVLEKLISFSREVKTKEIVFKSVDYNDLIHDVSGQAFVYMDPPYRLTTGAYNDGKRGFKGWDICAEQGMFEFAQKLNAKQVRFMISYVAGHRGKTNGELKRWLSENNFRVIECEDIQGIGRKEMVIVNYG